MRPLMRPLHFAHLYPHCSGQQPTLEPSTRRWGADKANYYVPAIGALGGCPFFLVCLYANNFYVSLCVGLLGECVLPAAEPPQSIRRGACLPVVCL